MTNSETQKFINPDKSVKAEVRETMQVAYQALKEKGYNPFSQIVGYILSGDPTYITGHMNARAMMSKIDRDELLEELVRFYVIKTTD